MSKDEEYNLWWWLVWASDTIHRARRQELRKYKISGGQGAALAIIQSIPDKATPTEIAKRFFRKTQTICELLSRMETEGLVQRVKDLRQKNQVRFVLTEKGLEAYHQASKRESIKRIMSCLTKEERHCLKSMCQKLSHKALEGLGMQPNTEWPL